MKIYYTEELENAALQDLAAVNRGLVRAAIDIRDEARAKFSNNRKNYKIGKFQDAIMLGKLKKDQHQIAVHGFGSKNSNKELYKARFFILGTRYRKQNKINGQPLKQGRNIGRIEGLNTLDEIITEANVKLQKCIKNAIEQQNK